MFKKSNGIRSELINALTREQLIRFIKWKDNVYQEKYLEEYSDNKLRDIAKTVDIKAQAKRKKSK